jgi:prepilin-type N-terminal cleavage/methylation domain-containing protein/prepilin-type processing-associated H-X9-DG protein
MNQSIHCRRAYTLIELLVVISIISLLSALSFTVFSRVREKGRAAHCQSNLHQLGLAFQQYVSDSGAFPLWYNNDFPIGVPLPGPNPGLSWGRRVQPYVKDISLFQCPSASSSISIDPRPTWSGNDYGYSDYTYNMGLSGLADSKVTQPAEVVMLFDGDSAPAYLALWNNTNEATDSGNRHSGGFHVLFVDGHVKWTNWQYAMIHDYGVVK